MNESQGFFSQNHDRLISIAVWAKYLAWVALIVYTLWAIGTYLQEQNYYLYYRSGGIKVQTYRDFIDLLRQAPSYAFSVFIEIVGIFLRGIVYFLVLKGISLGLNMVVETDINYREAKNEQ
jgi:hypothetical protein